MPENKPILPTNFDCPEGHECPLFDELEQLRATIAELEEHAQTDSLTGLFNKRFFDNSLVQEIDRTLRTGQPTTLLLLDVDHFKSFNDSYGHLAGDNVLKHLAELFRANLRKLDIPCRYGGEEFAILLPSTPLLVAVQVADRLRNVIENSPLTWQGKELAITASIGVDYYPEAGKESPDAFVQRVDEHLYRAKQNGRNCVMHGTLARTPAPRVSGDEQDLLRSLDNDS